MARSFDGVNNLIDFGDNLRIDGNVGDPQTVLICYQMPDTSGEGKFIIAKQDNFSNGRGWYFFALTSGFMSFNFIGQASNAKTSDGDSTIDDDNWHVCCGTVDNTANASGINIYVDGSADSMTTGSDNLTVTTVGAETMRIACREGCTFGEFNGDFGMWAQWDTEFGAARAAALTSGVNPLGFGKVGMRLFVSIFGNESPEPDWSGNDFDGTVTGTTKFAGNPPIELMENYL